MAKDLTDKSRGGGDVDAFLSKVASTPKRAHGAGRRGRLLFAMDATASRQPTWDTAARIQGEMFLETAALGGLEVQLAFYRGFGEFKVGSWTDNEKEMLRLVSSVFCLAGETQLAKVLQHAVNQAKTEHLSALIFIGDCVEEDIDKIGKVAGELGILGVPAFMFHEGADPVGRFAFEQVAKLTGGACVSFDRSSAETLKKLLGAVAVYAAGGHKALENKAKQEGGAILQITDQMRRSR